MGVFQLTTMVKKPTPASNNGTRIVLVPYKNAKTGVLFSRHVNMSERCICAFSVSFKLADLVN